MLLGWQYYRADVVRHDHEEQYCQSCHTYYGYQSRLISLSSSLQRAYLDCESYPESDAYVDSKFDEAAYISKVSSKSK